MSTERPLLSIEGLHSWFTTSSGTVRAVSDVSLAVAAGRRLGIVGESGSGKTQTFFGVFGLASGAPGVVAGSARFGDAELLQGLSEFVHSSADAALDNTATIRKDAAGWSRHQQRQLQPIMGRQVGILFQDPKRSLIPYWTVGRQMQDVLQRAKSDATDRSTASDLLRSLGFRDPDRIMNSYPESLSGGEAQRVLLAVTLGMRPTLLVADEPTTGLDMINQAKVLDALLQVQQAAGMALILISHDLAIVDAVVDEVVVMFGGRVMERASTQAMRALPDEQLHPYTRALRDSQRRRAVGAPITGAPLQQSSARVANGCPFQARCALKPALSESLQRRCVSEVPAMTTLGAYHAAACWGLGA